MRHRGVWAVIIAVSLVAGGVVAPTSEARAASPAPTPVVSGNQLVDSRTGTPWVAHAVNWPSFEYACQQGWAYAQDGRTSTAAQAMVSWGITAVRLPLNEACWLGIEGSPAYGSVSGYRAAVAAWVSTLNAAGLVAILDLHWSSPPGYPANGQRAMADARSVTFWQQVGAAYASNGSVMFDVFNEPYSRWNDAISSWAFQLTWTCWRDGGCQAPVENDQTGTLSGATYPVAGMSSLVQAIRSAGAGQPILLGGLDYSNDLRGWLANRPADTQLVASWHNYPAQRCRTVTCWNSEIAPVAAVVPVIATEFGQTDGGNGFLTTFMTWADTHGVGYAPWAWWRTDASDGTAANLYALIADDAFTPKAPSGTAFHDHLAGTTAPAGPLGVATGPPVAVAGGTRQTYSAGMLYAHPTYGTWGVRAGPIATAYQANGGVTGSLGWPNADQSCTAQLACAQPFTGGVITSTPSYGAHVLWGGYRDQWISSGGLGGPYGAALNDIAFIGGAQGAAWQQNFEKGVLVQTTAGFRFIPYSSVLQGWIARGGAGGVGLPTGDYSCGSTGCAQAFAGGVIASGAYGPQLIVGGFIGEWTSRGGVSGSLGVAFGPLRYTPGARGGWAQNFAGGILTQSATGFRLVPYGPIQALWTSSGEDRGAFGWPTAERGCAALGCVQQFERAILSESSWGAFPIVGGFADYWNSHSGSTTIGPAVNALRYSSVSGGGYAQHFAVGVITQTAAGSPVLTPYGAILDMWYRYGAESTWLGWPTAAPVCTTDGCRQNFQHGVARTDTQGHVSFSTA